ncbi:MAG: P27 family phage terminase small subunit [Lachnospiraceae bacterium]|nr:P27 family phage terminase small subunit [Lachnospiraceae bacterium]
MARPAKSLATVSGAMTKAECEEREKKEKKLRGKSDKVKPPRHLTNDQKKIFRYIVNETKEADILGNLDIYVLTTAAICIDRLVDIEKQINENPQLLLESKLMSAREKYSKDFFRCCNELSLSPQSRAKISIANVKAIKENRNPILDVLEDDDD